MKPNTGKAAAANDDSAQVTNSKELDPALMELLKQYKERHALSNEALGKRLGYNGTYCVRAFGGKFEGDSEGFQQAVRKLIDDEFQMRLKPEELCESGFMVKPMTDFLNNTRTSRSIGMAWSAPGKGKSKALEISRRKDPLCILVTVCKSMGGWRGLRDAVLEAVPNKRRLRGESWDQWMTRTFKGSGRLLVIDNAELLTTSARDWIAFDWHDFTKIDCPVALVANEEIVAQWKKNEKHWSRVGVAYEIKSTQKATDTARELVRLYMPGSEGDEEAVSLTTTVLKSGGACRAAEKHLLLAADLIKGAERYTPGSAIRAANTLLLTSVNLAA